MKNLLFRKYSKGFTLIELLVVIAIIGILASVVLASLSTSRASARDANRLTEAKQLQTALEIYRNNNNNQYPCANSLANNTGCTTPLSSQAAAVDLNNGSATSTTFLSLINFTPTLDPTWGGGNGSIRYRVDGTPALDRSSYTIALRLENGRTNSAGTLISLTGPMNGWCSISVGAGHDSWNNTTVNTYPPCF